MTADETDALRRRRRRVLAGTAATLAAGLAGCAALPDGIEEDPGTPTVQHLRDTPVYVAEGVDLTVSPEVETVGSADDAELIVLPDDTDVDAGRAADWLVADRVVALLGDEAQATWIDWVQRDAFEEAFPSGEHAVGEPAPQLLAGVAVEDRVSTHRWTWDDGPSDRDVLRALEEVLADLATETPA